MRNDDIAQLRRMCLIREFETRAVQLYAAGEIKGSLHSSAGQEAVAVGVCSQLTDADYITSTHRGHGHAIAKGASIDRLMAELMGRATGYCRGKGGSMHVADFGIGMLGANGIVAAGIPMAVGAAYASQIRGEDRIAVAFFGDGALAEGVLWESVNLAALWKLPVVFVAENNQYAVSLGVRDGFAAKRIADVPESFGVPSAAVDGMSLVEVREAVETAVRRARERQGPSFVECLTYRFTGHSRGDPNHGPYRTKEEWASWLEKDPIPRFAAEIGAADQLDELNEEAAAQVEAATERAREAPFPTVESAYEDVFPSEVAAT
jgi:pyruvate dehydrogenase E1 component alpha subunit